MRVKREDCDYESDPIERLDVSASRACNVPLLALAVLSPDIWRKRSTNALQCDRGQGVLLSACIPDLATSGAPEK